MTSTALRMGKRARYAPMLQPCKDQLGWADYSLVHFARLLNPTTKPYQMQIAEPKLK